MNENINEEELNEENDEIAVETLENRLNLAREYFNKLVSNSIKTKYFDKNLLNIKYDFALNILEKITLLNNSLKNYNIDFRIDLKEEEIYTSISKIEIFFEVLKDLSFTNDIESNKDFFYQINEKLKNRLDKNLNSISYKIKNSSFVSNNINIQNFIKVNFLNYLEKILKIENFEDTLSKEINSLEKLEEYHILMFCNKVEELYQESEIFIFLTEKFAVQKIWLEALLDVLIYQVFKDSKENLENDIKNLIEQIQKIVFISKKIIQNSLIDFDNDEDRNYIESIRELNIFYKEKYNSILEVTNDLFFNYMEEEFPYLEEKEIKNPFMN